MKCILVDDEHLALLRLESQIKETGLNVSIESKCSTGKDAINQINILKPDVVFLDIQMPEIDGFQVIEQLEYIPLIVFTTAYNEFALKAFQAKGIRYLLKPIKLSDLTESIQFVENYLNTPRINSSIKTETIIVKELGKQLLIPIDKIEIVTTLNRIVFIYFDGKKIIADKGMEDYASQLPSDSFFRTHRSYIININFISSIEKGVGGKRIIHMKNNIEATVSRENVKEFERLFNR